MHLIENKYLQYANDEIKSCRCTYNTGKNKKESPGFVCIYSKSFFKICVNACKIHLVIQRQQHVCNDQVSEEITDHYLEIIKISAANSTGHTYKCDPTK